MENLNNIEVLTKIIIGIISIIATIGKLKELFANSKLKQELNTDLDILEKIKKNNNLYNLEVENKIKNNLSRAYNNKNEDFTDFLYGLALFVGFGFWTINLFGDFSTFNPWAILTLTISFIGLSISFNINKIEESKEQPFYKIGIFEKTNFKFTLIVLIFVIIALPIMILNIRGFSYWYILIGSFGIMSLIKLKKIIRKI